jgi:hypothetical protein
MSRPSYPRRQQYRRMHRAVVSAAASATAAGLALAAARTAAPGVAAALLLVTVALLIDARRWLRLAGRSRVGARSEDEVQRALAQLETEGWRLRHSLPWRGRGDIDSVAIAPTGVAFAIETKNQNPRGPAPCPCARAGGMADPSPATMVQTRCAAGRVPCSTAWSRACRGRRAGGLDRPAYVCPRHLRRAARSSGLPPVTSPGCRG